MNAKTIPAPPGLRSGPSESARMAGRSDRKPSGRIPPIEQRFSPPASVYRGVDPVAVWPDRPRISRDSRKRSQGAWSLMLFAGAVVFALGAIRVAPFLNFDARPVIIHLFWAV